MYKSHSINIELYSFATSDFGHIGIHTWIEKIINTIKLKSQDVMIIKSEISIDLTHKINQ
jgi:hypothetical protein